MNRIITTEGEKDFVSRTELYDDETGYYAVNFNLAHLDFNDPEVHALLHKIQKDLNDIYTAKLAKLFGLSGYIKT